MVWLSSSECRSYIVIKNNHCPEKSLTNKNLFATFSACGTQVLMMMKPKLWLQDVGISLELKVVLCLVKVGST